MGPSRRRNPHRRAAAMAFLTVLTGLAAWNAAVSVWFIGAFSRNGELVWTELRLHDLASYGMVQGPTGGIPATYTIAGYPAVQVWLLLGVLFGVVAVLLRLGLFSLFAVGMIWLARSAAVSTETILLSPAAQNRFAQRGTEFLNFLDLSWMLMALLVVLTAQITYANHVQRRETIARGAEPDQGVLDVFTNIQSSVIGRYARPTTTQRTTAKVAAPAGSRQ